MSACFPQVQELREFRVYLRAQTSIEELRGLNLLGVQFEPCCAGPEQCFAPCTHVTFNSRIT